MNKKIRRAAIRILAGMKKDLKEGIGRIEAAVAALPKSEVLYRINIDDMWHNEGGHSTEAAGSDLEEMFRWAVYQHAVTNNRTDFQATVRVTVVSAGLDIELPPIVWNDLYNKYITCPYCKGHDDDVGCKVCSHGKYTPRMWWLFEAAFAKHRTILIGGREKDLV